MISKKATRKTRVKKVKSAGTQVSSLKYKKIDPDLKVTSVDPTRIIGASTVYLFNAKTRNLTKLETNKKTGFEVKGTTIQNVDIENCLTYNIRKPE